MDLDTTPDWLEDAIIDTALLATDYDEDEAYAMYDEAALLGRNGGSGGSPIDKDDSWIVDGGSRRPYTNVKFPGLRPLRRPAKIGTAGSEKLHGTHAGDIINEDSSGRDLKDAMYSAKISHNIASVGTICDDTDEGLVHMRNGIWAGKVDLEGLEQIAVRDASTGYLYMSLPGKLPSLKNVALICNGAVKQWELDSEFYAAKVNEYGNLV